MIASLPNSAAARRLAAVPLVLAALVGTAGCASLQRAEPAPDVASITDDFPRSRRVALDFVDAMTTLSELDPYDTTLYTTRPGSRFGEILVTTLQGAGYDLRLGTDDAASTLRYEVRAASDARDRYTFLVVADGVRLERSYVADVAGIRPASTMRVAARDVAALATGPIATPVPLPAIVRAEPLATRAPRASAPSAPVAAARTRPASTRAADPAASGTDAARHAAPSSPIKRNMYETRRSNYAELLARYETVRREIMIFPNDSLHMGRDNKRLARNIADAFDPARDVISVIGCSHGRSALANGNETLANGRSYRVKEAFMLAGVAPDLVLEEGCWAGKHFDKMPARGVVVTHKRRANG